MMAGANGRTVDVRKRFGCKDHDAFFCAASSTIPELAGETLRHRGQASFVDDQQGRSTIEPALQPMKR